MLKVAANYYPSEYDDAARIALDCVEWDGEDWQTVVGVIVAVAALLEEAEHSPADISEIFEAIAVLGRRLDS